MVSGTYQYCMYDHKLLPGTVTKLKIQLEFGHKPNKNY